MTRWLVTRLNKYQSDRSGPTSGRVRPSGPAAQTHRITPTSSQAANANAATHRRMRRMANHEGLGPDSASAFALGLVEYRAEGQRAKLWTR